jgi:hypothetical protein
MRSLNYLSNVCVLGRVHCSELPKEVEITSEASISATTSDVQPTDLLFTDPLDFKCLPLRPPAPNRLTTPITWSSGNVYYNMLRHLYLCQTKFPLTRCHAILCSRFQLLSSKKAGLVVPSVFRRCTTARRLECSL